MEKKVIFIQPKFAHYRYGLFEELHKRMNITFVFLDKDLHNSEYNYPASTIENPNWEKKYLNANNNFFWYITLYKLILKEHPDAVVCSIPGSIQSIVAAIINKINHIPFVLFTETWTTNNRPNIWVKKKIRLIINRFVINNASSIVCGGSKSKAFYQNQGISNDKLFVGFQSTADISQSTNQLIKRSSDVNILFFSRLVKSKGADVLLRAFAKLQNSFSNIRLTIVGDGDARENCELLTQDLHLSNVEFCGSVFNEDAYKYYQKSDIFVLPCNGYKRGEAWGLVLNEAASMSLPIITTTVVGAVGDMVIDNRNGYVVQPNNIEELEIALSKLVEDQSLRVQMGKESRKIFEDINSYTKGAQAFYDAIEHSIKLKNV